MKMKDFFFFDSVLSDNTCFLFVRDSKFAFDYLSPSRLKDNGLIYVKSRWSDQLKFSLGVLLLTSFVAHNMCGTHQIKQPRERSLQRKPMRDILHARAEVEYKQALLCDNERFESIEKEFVCMSTGRHEFITLIQGRKMLINIRTIMEKKTGKKNNRNNSQILPAW